MAVAPVNAALATTATVNTVISGAVDCTGANLIVAAFSWSAPSPAAAPTAVTYNGVAMTLVSNQITGGAAQGRVAIYYQIDPASGSHTLSVTFGAAQDELQLCGQAYSGVNTKAPVGTATAASGSTTAPSISVAGAINDLVVDGVFIIDDAVGTPTLTVGSGQTQLANISADATVVRFGASTEPGAASVTMSWTTNGIQDQWAQVGVALKAPLPGTSGNFDLSLRDNGTAAFDLNLLAPVANVIGRSPISGPGISPDSMMMFAAPRRAIAAAVNPDVTVALTGIAMTVTAGSLGVAHDQSITGIATTLSAGSVTVNVSVPLVGIATTFSVGTLGVTLDVPITGLAITFSAGIVTPSGGDVTVALTGISMTVSAGTLVPTFDVPVTGIASTLAAGNVTPSASVALTGVAATLSAGTLTPSTDVPLTGIATSLSPGTVTPSGGDGADVTVAITGISMTLFAGHLIPSGGDVPSTGGIGSVGGGGGMAYRCPIGYRWEKGKCRRIPLNERPNAHLKALLDDVAAIYSELKNGPSQAKAAKIVKPFSDDKRAAIPEVASVDWAALDRDAKRVDALIALWRKQQTERYLRDDEETWMML